MRKHFFNEHFFADIDNERKAYWLGFIAADGSVTKTSKWNSYRLQINLKYTDRAHLELFRKHIEAHSTQIYEFENDSSNRGFGKCRIARFVLNSQILYEDLVKLNIILNKTNNLAMPFIREDLIRHFLRGYIDGDGSFSYTRRKEDLNRFRYSFEIVGNSKEILEQFIDYFERHQIKVSMYQRKGGKSFRLMTGSGPEIKKISRLIYHNSSVYLERKFLKVQEIERLVVDKTNWNL
ncbi:LAGLIDADG family homing endonuclease [Peribacillus sp. NPDC046944]|uniref:LAGLIDADG family homing endonuclease n=1 Tax=unclassified Peribacillus TaxID=2675266 RepID=UPI0038193F94